MNKAFSLFLLLTITFCYAQNEYLNSAIKTASWLNEMKTYSNRYYVWKQSETNFFPSTSMVSGASGIGLFYLNLYIQTKNNDYLNEAKTASNYIRSATDLKVYEWLGGIAGNGDFELAMYEETGDQMHLERAEFYAENLLNNATYQTDEKLFWYVSDNFHSKVYTGFAHGTTGIVYFLTKLYKINNDPKIIATIEKAYNWLMDYTVEYSDTEIGFKRLTTDTEEYILWCGGTTGTVWFVGELYEATGDQKYLILLQKMGNALIKNAIKISSSQCFWPYYPSGNSKVNVYCHGAGSTASALFYIHKITGDTKYYDAAVCGANYLISNAIMESDETCYWKYFETDSVVASGYLTGVASIGKAFIEFYEFTHNAEYLDYANKCCNYIISKAEVTPNDGYKWIDYFSTKTYSDNSKDYYTGWYTGAAGIGLLLTDCHKYNSEFTSIDENSNEEQIAVSVYPNPALGNPVIKVKYSANNIVLNIYNSLGQKLDENLYSIKFSNNYFEVKFNTALASGRYFIKATNNKKSISSSFLIVH